MPKEKYTHAPEILEHSQRDRRALRPLRQRVLPDRGHRAALGRATRALDRLDQPRRRDAGPLRRAWPTGRCTGRSCPASPASTTFEGHTFHTSRWDYDYTGGDSDGGPRPACATSASASSAPARRPCSACRTSARRPSSCTCSSARRRRSTCAATARPIPSGPRASSRAGSSSGWTTSTSSCPAASQDEDLVNDGWTDIIGKLLLHDPPGRRGDDSPPRRLARDDGAGRLREDGADPRPGRRRSSRTRATAEALKPYYRQFCKRPCFHDEYLDTFNRPNVTLVDTDGKGVERITEHGVVVDGVEYEVDCLIFATGFEVGTDYTRRAGYEIIGRDGADADREVGRRRVDVARHAQPRLPELLHHQHRAVGLHGELPAHARRAEQAHSPTSSATRSTTTSTRSRRRRRPRTAWVRDDPRAGPDQPGRSSSRARPATTTTRASRTPRAFRERSVRRRLDRLRGDVGGLARGREAGGPRAHRVTNLS